MEERPQPLVLFMESTTGEEVSLTIEPEDNFQNFLDKAKTVLGYDVDLNSITCNQPVSLEDNVYWFFTNTQETVSTESGFAAKGYQSIVEPANENDDTVYILDDGTQIKASQIHFDNEDPLIDITSEKIPFKKYVDNGYDESDIENLDIGQTIDYNILKSPISHLSSRDSSPKQSFVNRLPFRLICNSSVFEAQFTKYLEANANKTYATLNPVTTYNKSPRSLIQDNYKKYNDNRAVNFTSFTREEVLNMFKDPPAVAPYVGYNYMEKKRHVRKSNPSRLLYNINPGSYINVDGILISQSESQNCFICSKFVNSSMDKMYIFDKEDQKLHRSPSVKKDSTQLKIICEGCLNENFKPCRTKSPNESLNPDEFLVIQNNQQYIFQKIKHFESNYGSYCKAQAIIDKIENQILKNKDKERNEFLKVEIGSDGEIVTKSVNSGSRSSDDVIVIKDDDSLSSDVEIIEPNSAPDDNIIENLEEADEDVKEFLGKHAIDNSIELKELKCRFCSLVFADLAEVIEHGDQHKHDLEDGLVFPCPLCDYGYADFKWLKGHLKAAHDKITKVDEDADKEENRGSEEQKKENMSANENSDTPTRNLKKERDEDVKDVTLNNLETEESEEITVTGEEDKDTSRATNEGEDDKRVDDSLGVRRRPPPIWTPDILEEYPNGPAHTSELLIKMEVKQEALDTSDEEGIWIVQTGDDEEATKKLQQILQDNNKSEKINESEKPDKCQTCSETVTTENSTTHKCSRKRGRRRRTAAEEDPVCVPSEEESIKRTRRRTTGPTYDPQVVACHNCNESFTSKVRLKFHMQFHEPPSTMRTRDGKYLCTECESVTFETESELFDHVHFQHDKQRRWQCPYKECGKSFYLRATLTKHSRSHTDTRRYVCGTCGKRFLDKQTLDEHGVTHLQIKPYQCHICMKQLTRRSRLRMHMRAHEEELCPKLILVCAVCSRAFRDHEEAQDHASRSAECIEQFANELKEDPEESTVQLSPTSGLVRHTIQVTESPKFSKPIHRQVDSAEAQALLSQLPDEARAIIRVVEIEKAFRCEYCEDVFYSEDGLNTHRAIHKDVKNPFTCHICKVTFATYSRCTTHKTTHGFYKRSLADVMKEAEKSPNSKLNTKTSAVRILGYGGFPVVKHFLCEDCGRSYLHWTYLQVHRRMKHGNENFLYKCNNCDVTFPNSWSLAYHRKKNHTRFGMEDSITKIPKDVGINHRIPCRDCDEILPNKNALYRHRKNKHSDIQTDCGSDDADDPNSCVCGKCSKGPSQTSQLQKRFHSTAACNHRLVHSGTRTWTCDRCPRRFRIQSDLRTHKRLKHPTQCAVIEIESLCPSPDEIMEKLASCNISQEKIIGITKISFSQGTTSIVPNSAQALSMLSGIPRTPIACGKRNAPHYDGTPAEFQPTRRGRGIAKNPRRPKILQRGRDQRMENDEQEDAASYPLAISVTGQELSGMQMLLGEAGVHVEGEQIVQMQLNNADAVPH